jgi:glucokinase
MAGLAERSTILAADVGGTKTLLGLFDARGDRPEPIAVQSFQTAAFQTFSSIVDAFARSRGGRIAVETAVVGIAGPVVGTRAVLTNGSWGVDTDELARCSGGRAVALLNDLSAMAYSVEALAPDEIETVQPGRAVVDGNAAVIAAGTGLGQAILHRVGAQLIPVASEGGHADFAARTPREMELTAYLTRVYGRASVEHVLSGPGLANLHAFTHGTRACRGVRPAADGAVSPADVTSSALGGGCPRCVESLELFTAALGAEAGNLVLRGMATAGVYVGGGIAPKILPALTNGSFVEAFRAKAPMSALLAAVPVRIILFPEAGLLGAAIHARRLLEATRPA